jgi:hypothetical protein
MLSYVSHILFLLALTLLLACSGPGGSGGSGHHGGGGGHGGGRHGGGSEGVYGSHQPSNQDVSEPLIGKELAPAFSVSGHEEGKATVLGTVSCDLWVRALSDANEGKMARLNNYKAWVYGYLSGLSSATRKEHLDESDAATINLFMSDYCRSHPNDTTAVAAQHLARELIARHPAKIKEPPTRKQ